MSKKTNPAAISALVNHINRKQGTFRTLPLQDSRVTAALNAVTAPLAQQIKQVTTVNPEDLVQEPERWDGMS